MTEQDTLILKFLLTKQRVATLAILVDEKPFTGLLTFAILPDFSAAILQASNLAKHTAGLTDGAPYSLLIHLPDDPKSDPLQLARVSLQGTVQKLPKGEPEYETAKVLYLTKFPASANIFPMSDFNLYALAFHQCRFVAGFGAIYSLPPEKLKELSEA
ncbi:MAG: hypothetical protein HUU38_00015 [Anaerolineales bacterium]|nr:hypothetical protein [Anaerolineales bacterium]